MDSRQTRRRSSKSWQEPAESMDYLKGLRNRLHDPSLLDACPELPPAPLFFKHTEKNAQLPPSTKAGAEADDEAIADARSPLKAPRGAYKMLSSDYAWLDHPSKAPQSYAAVGSQEPLPEPPQELQQAKFFSRARLVMVKLRNQVNEVLSETIRIVDEEMKDPHQVGFSTISARPGSRSGGAAGGGAGKNPSGGAAGGKAASAGKDKKEEQQGTGNPVLDAVGALMQGKISAMFDDGLDDMMDQLWGAFQYAAVKGLAVDQLKQAMIRRDEEIEAIAMRRVPELEAQVAKLNAELEKTNDLMFQERIMYDGLLLAERSAAEHLTTHMSLLQRQLQQVDVLKAQLQAVEAQRQEDLKQKDEEVQQAHVAVQDKLEELKALNRGAHEQVHQRDAEIEALRQRLAEQLQMLETAFVRRDVEIKRSEALGDVVAEFTRLMAGDGQMPITKWAEACFDAGSYMQLQEGELLLGDYGCAKAFLIAARRYGMSGVIAELKKALPEELPAYHPPERTTSNAPRIATGESHVRELVPDLWVRLMKAPLQKTLPGPVLLRHIQELYAAKEESDQACDAASAPRQGLHAVIFKTYLLKYHTPQDTERHCAVLLQSLRSVSKSDRVATFMQFMGMQQPGLTQEGLDAYLAFHRALRTPMQGLPQPVDDDGGAVSSVHPTKWRAVLAGPLGQMFGPDLLKSLTKELNKLRVEPSRSKASFGMHDMDAVMRAIMNTWQRYFQNEKARLMELFQDHDIRKDATFGFYEFRDMATNVSNAVSLTDSQALDMYHDALTDTIALRDGQPRARYAMAAPSFVKVCIKNGLIGLPRASNVAGLKHLRSAVDVVTSLVKLSMADVRREGLQTMASDQLELELVRLSERLADEANVDSDMVADGWGQLTALSRRAHEVTDDFVRKREAKRSSAANEFKFREEQLKDQLAAAKSEAHELRAEADKLRDEAEKMKGAWEEALAKAASAVAAKMSESGAASAHMGPGRPHSSHRRPGSGLGHHQHSHSPHGRPISPSGHHLFVEDPLEGELDEAPSPSASSVSSPHRARGHSARRHALTSHGADGEEPHGEGQEAPQAVQELQGQLERAQADLSRAQKRAEAAEAKFVQMRGEVAKRDELIEQYKQEQAKKAAKAAKKAAAAGSRSTRNSSSGTAGAPGAGEDGTAADGTAGQPPSGAPEALSQASVAIDKLITQPLPQLILGTSGNEATSRLLQIAGHLQGLCQHVLSGAWIHATDAPGLKQLAAAQSADAPAEAAASQQPAAPSGQQQAPEGAPAEEKEDEAPAADSADAKPAAAGSASAATAAGGPATATSVTLEALLSVSQAVTTLAAEAAHLSHAVHVWASHVDAMSPGKGGHEDKGDQAGVGDVNAGDVIPPVTATVTAVAAPASTSGANGQASTGAAGEKAVGAEKGSDPDEAAAGAAVGEPPAQQPYALAVTLLHSHSGAAAAVAHLRPGSAPPQLLQRTSQRDSPLPSSRFQPPDAADGASGWQAAVAADPSISLVAGSLMGPGSGSPWDRGGGSPPRGAARPASAAVRPGAQDGSSSPGGLSVSGRCTPLLPPLAHPAAGGGSGSRPSSALPSHRGQRCSPLSSARGADPAATGRALLTASAFPPSAAAAALARLSRAFYMSEEDLQELAAAVLLLVKQLGGFPVIAADGQLIGAEGEVLAQGLGGEQMLPDLATQASALQRLYIFTAGLIAAQHTRGSMLRQLEADMNARLSALQAAARRLLDRQQAVAAAEGALVAHLQGLGGAYKQLDLASAALSSISRTSVHCQDTCSTLASRLQLLPDAANPAAADARWPLPPSPAPEAPPPPAAATAAAAGELSLLSGSIHHGLSSLQEDVTNARAVLDGVRATMRTWADAGGAAAAAQLPAVQALLEQLANGAEGREAAQRDAQYARLLLNLKPGELFRQQPGSAQPAPPPGLAPALYGAAAAGDAAEGQPQGDRLRALQQQWQQQQNPILHDYAPRPTPPPSPRPPEEAGAAAAAPGWLDLSAAADQASGLPPGEDLIVLSDALLARRHAHSPSRYRSPPRAFGGDGSYTFGGSPGRRPPHGAAMMRSVASAAWPWSSALRYQRRPLAARAYVDSIMAHARDILAWQRHRLPEHLARALQGAAAAPALQGVHRPWTWQFASPTSAVPWGPDGLAPWAALAAGAPPQAALAAAAALYLRQQQQHGGMSGEDGAAGGSPGRNRSGAGRSLHSAPVAQRKARMMSMDDAVGAGRTAAAVRAACRAASPELAAWGEQEPATISPPRVATRQLGMAAKSPLDAELAASGAPNYKFKDISPARQPTQTLFPGVRVDSAGNVVVAGPHAGTGGKGRSGSPPRHNAATGS